MSAFEEHASRAMEAVRRLESACWNYEEQITILREENDRLRADLARANVETRP